jgi:hypothetical protein
MAKKSMTTVDAAVEAVADAVPTATEPGTRRRCIGSKRYGIEAHEAPVEDFPRQPSQRDGLGRMCKVHWNAYTAGLARDAKTRKALEGGTVVEAGVPAAEDSAPVTPPAGKRRRVASTPQGNRYSETIEVALVPAANSRGDAEIDQPPAAPLAPGGRPGPFSVPTRQWPSRRSSRHVGGLSAPVGRDLWVARGRTSGRWWRAPARAGMWVRGAAAPWPRHTAPAPMDLLPSWPGRFRVRTADATRRRCRHGVRVGSRDGGGVTSRRGAELRSVRTDCMGRIGFRHRRRRPRPGTNDHGWQVLATGWKLAVQRLSPRDRPALAHAGCHRRRRRPVDQGPWRVNCASAVRNR